MPEAAKVESAPGLSQKAAVKAVAEQQTKFVHRKHRCGSTDLQH
jgi:hypothetical protein